MSDGNPISPSAVGPFLRYAWRLTPWAVRHPWISRPEVWLGALVLWLAVALAFAAARIRGWEIYAGMLVVLAFILGGIYGWRCLTRPSERMVVFISRFAGATPEALSAGISHNEALLERLQENGLLNQVAELRIIEAPLVDREAARLLDVAAGRAVVFGHVRTAGDQYRLRSELLLRWPGDETPTTHVEARGQSEDFGRDRAVPPRHETTLDAAQPLERLVAERYETNAADRIEGTLLALAAAALRHNEVPSQASVPDRTTQCLTAANRFRPALSTQTRATMEIYRAGEGGLTDYKTILDQLERAARGDADHVDLWNFVSFLAFGARTAGVITAEEQVAYAERAVEADPSDGTARYNLGEALMEVNCLEDALVHLDAALQDRDYVNRYYVHHARGVINYTLGHYEAARDAYERELALRPSSTVHLFLADTYRVLGRPQQSMYHYRQALLREPTLVDALRGYNMVALDVGAPPEEQPRVFNRATLRLAAAPAHPLPLNRWLRPLLSWLLKRHYRRHPEDERLHFMLGYTALLQRDYAFAEERLMFAYQLVGGNDLPALAAAALAKALQGRLDDAKADLVRLRDAPVHPGDPPHFMGTLLERAVGLTRPVNQEPRLAYQPGFSEFIDLSEEVFEPALRAERERIEPATANGH